MIKIVDLKIFFCLWGGSERNKNPVILRHTYFFLNIATREALIRVFGFVFYKKLLIFIKDGGDLKRKF